MRIFVDKNLLATSLGRVQSIVERRHSIPILANVKIETKEDAITLSTTDMDLFVTDIISAKVESAGAVTIPVHTLFEITRKIPDGSPISIGCDNKGDDWRVSIESGSVKCTLPGIAPKDFPNFISEDYVSTFKMPATTLHKILIDTRYAMALEETRYYLNGVYLHIISNNGARLLRAVATDSHRLVMSDVELPSEVLDFPNIIIPRKAVNEIAKLLDEAEGDVEIGISNNKFMIQVGNTALISKLIDGKFPDYLKAVPTQNDKRLEVGAKQLASAIDLVTTVSSDKTKAVKMKMESNKLTLFVSSAANGGADANQEIEASFDHDAMEIAFNGKYMADILSIVNGQVVNFFLSSESGAAIIMDQEDESSKHILMPMQV